MNQQPSFFDKRTLFAMLLVFAGILGWNYYLSMKYPKTQAANQPQKSADGVTPETSTSLNNITEPQIEKTETVKTAGTATEAPTKETFYKYEGEKLSFDISTRGMGLKNIIIKSYTQRDKTPVVLGKDLVDQYMYETQLKGEMPLYFKIENVSDTEIKGVATRGATIIEKTYIIDPELSKIDIAIKVQNPTQPLLVYLVENVSQNNSQSLLPLPTYDFESLFVAYEGTTKRVDIKSDATHVLEETLNNVTIVSLGGHYFTAALVDESPLAPSITAKIQAGDVKRALATLEYDFTSATRTYDLKQVGYVGPKEIKALAAVNEQLTQVVNYGIFSWIAVPILKLLKLLYSALGNYGVAIILVTLVIRLILMPINVSSYKSMKAMQQVQPKLKAIKEKYKNDPKRVQVETMNVMKENKVNPLGGCLPMLLQLPIFIALYNVLGQSIELYQAPFILWIKDLSIKDPFYVLPVLMGITMYVQQKITPTTMDPAQAKVMQFMPVIFCLFMIGLPSGLTLYIFVSTLFGIIQQYLFMNDRKNKKNIITLNNAKQEK